MVGGICIFYTSIGGMKAVIWTDVWQIMWMVAGFVAILAVTCIDFGGFMEVVNLNIVSHLALRRCFHKFRCFIKNIGLLFGCFIEFIKNIGWLLFLVTNLDFRRFI